MDKAFRGASSAVRSTHYGSSVFEVIGIEEAAQPPQFPAPVSQLF